MSKIDKLIALYCPDGIEYKRLGDLGTFFGGLTGKSKNDFFNGNAKFISYMNVYLNPSIDQGCNDTVKIGKDEKQRTLQYCDICFTGSSETPDECGISSVVTETPSEPLYLNSFCFFLRLDNPEMFNPHYLKHLFRGSNLRRLICKTANGVTRFNVSKELMKEVEIPIPPLPVQNEIAYKLDEFSKLETELATELETELTLRQKQYEYYRGKLLSFSPEIERRPLGGKNGVCDLIAGATPSKAKSEYWNNGTISWMSSGEVNNKRIFRTEHKISQMGYDNASTTLVPIHSVVMALAGQGKTRGKVAITEIELCTNQSLCSMICHEEIDYRYLYYYLDWKYEELRSISNGDGSRGGLSLRILSEYKIPIPIISEQKRIADILDKFSSLVNETIDSIYLNITIRHQQYEYYRDKLLSFNDNRREIPHEYL